MLKPCGWQEDSEKRVCWVLKESGKLFLDKLGSTSSDSGSTGLGWAMRFCISNKLAGDADAAGLWAAHFSCKAKRWAASSSGRRTEQGTPRRRCPILLCVSGLCLPHTPYLVCPLIAAGHLRLVLPNGEAVSGCICSLIRRKLPPLLYGLVTLLSLSQNICIWMPTLPHPSHPVALSSPCNSL